MKWCVEFPEEDILIKRPCLKRACGGNKATAAFLSYLLYQVSISQEYKKNAENINKRKAARGETPDQDMTISIYRSQLEIIEEMDNEISDRTLRDTAIPLLVALGYIEVDESDKINVYDVHLDAVQRGIKHPRPLSEILPILKRLADDGNTSDKSRKHFRRLAEILPSSSELAPGYRGNTSDGKNGGRASSQAGSDTIRRERKRIKSNYDLATRVVEDKGAPAESQNEEPAAPAAQEKFDLNEEEIAFIRALRQQRLSAQQPTSEERATVPPAPETAPQASEQAAHALSAPEPDLAAAQHVNLPDSAQTPGRSADPPIGELPRPASGAPLTDVVIVQLWEFLRQIRYSEAERRAQLQAAQELLRLSLPIPLSADVLERVYTTFLDDFWRRKFRGVMNVSHLVGVEVSTGQVRIARWLILLQERDQLPPPATQSTGGQPSANGIDYNALTGLTEEELREQGRQQRERNDRRYAEAGLDQAEFMKLSAAERIAVMRKLREEGKLPGSSSAASAVAQAK